MKDETFDYKIYKEADRRQLLVQVAKMYYHDDLSQNDIAAKINVSRSNVSKMLQACKTMGIVEFHINEITSRCLEVGNELQAQFKMKLVQVVPFFADQEELKNNIGKVAARYLQTQIHTGMTIGISGGSTLRRVVDYFHPPAPLQIDVVQLMGGVGARDPSIDGVQLAYTLAAKLSGRCTVIPAPLVVQNREAKTILLQEPEISGAIASAARADIAVIGIGSSYPESNALIRAGYLTKSETIIIREKGAVGNMLGRLLNENGDICRLDMNERVIGLAIEDLKKIPVRVGVAGGIEKSEAILGTLRQGYINVLITDESAALRILQAGK
jgi:deoxyribonucleoside regulator